MILKNYICISFIFVLYGCAGIQNTSYVVQDYKIDGAPFLDIKSGTIYFQGMDSAKVDDPFTPSDTGKGFFTRDSLNKVFFEEFNKQFLKRFPKINISQAPINISLINSGYLLRIEDMALAWTKENIFLVDPQGVPIALFKARITFVDLSTRLHLFTLIANAEVVLRVYSEPWRHGVKLCVTRILDYIESDGKKHRSQPAG